MRVMTNRCNDSKGSYDVEVVNITGNVMQALKRKPTRLISTKPDGCFASTRQNQHQ
jgi:hypothetical protein